MYPGDSGNQWHPLSYSGITQTLRRPLFSLWLTARNTSSLSFWDMNTSKLISHVIFSLTRCASRKVGWLFSGYTENFNLRVSVSVGLGYLKCLGPGNPSLNVQTVQTKMWNIFSNSKWANKRKTYDVVCVH